MTRTNDAYAWAGPEAAVGYEPNGLNQYEEVGAANYSYDANGNLTSDGVRTFKYDNENRLVSRTGAAGGTTTLRYDPLGRLHEVAGTQATTEFLWDGDALVSEYDNAGTLLRRYAHGGQEGVDDPLVWTEAGGGGTHRLLHADHQGSIIAIAEPDGSNHAINAYDAWGVPREPVVGRFGYTGQIWVPEIGLYHYKARMYSPTLGRFIQTDPIGYEGGINLYAYVANDPINLLDPTGESCDTGSLLGEAAQCRVHMDFQIEGEGEPRAAHGPRAYGGGGGGGAAGEDGTGILQNIFGCESAMTCAMARDDRAVLSGRMSREEYVDRAEARAGGVAAGVGIHVIIRSGTVVLVAAGRSAAERMVLSNRWGVFSERFGNRFLRSLFNQSRPGTLNQGAVRLGWSYNARTGTLTFQPRAGGLHVPSPIRIRVPEMFR